MTRRLPPILIAALLAGVFGAGGARAQYPFGKNKVLYAPKEWQILQTEHVDCYHYPDEAPIARFIAERADSVYREYAAFFRVEFSARIPVIVYGTHHDFSETNVTPFLVSESVAGFTEFMKGRIALPFTGSYPKLEHVFRHELVHAFMLEKLRVVTAKHRRWGYEGPPLWFTEGLAEYLADRVPDAEARMFMRDAVTSDLVYPLPELWRIQGSYLMYKEGESAIGYIAARFGDEAFVLLLENWWRYDRFDVLVERTLGVSPARLSDDWMAYLKRRYYPAVLDRRPLGETGVPLTPTASAFEMHPVRAGKTGDAPIFAIGYDRGGINIMRFARNGDGPRRRSIAIAGGRRTAFESIPTLRSRLSSRGDTLLFVSKAGERDAIYLYDVARGRVVGAVRPAAGRIVSSPSLSPDGRWIAFSAIDPFGKSDLFVCDASGGSLRRLTDDYYEDASPDWHPARSLIVFSSDRGRGAPGPFSGLYTIDPAGGAPEPLSTGPWSDTDPRWLEDGSGILFASDRDGTPDIYLLRDGAVTRQTNALGGAMSPAPCGADSFLCAGYGNGTFRCYLAPLRDARPAPAPAPAAPDTASWRPELVAAAGTAHTTEYRMKLGLDLIGATFALDPDYSGTGSGAQLFFTDILGNHQLAVLVGTATDEFDQIFEKLNVSLTYVNLERRLNYALGAFRLASFIGTDADLLRYEERVGGLASVVYPFSTFMRGSVSVVLRYMEREDDIYWSGGTEGRSWLLSQYVGLTYDNIVWSIGGPLTGSRVSATIGNTTDLRGSRYESTTLNLDARNYVALSERVVFAQRFVTRNAWGSDLQLYYLGGSWDLHGYRFRQFAGTRTMLLNSELRFPLIDRFVLKFPVGLIEFPLFRGSLFVDAARVEGFLRDTDWIGSLGTGIEMNLGYLPVARVNFSRRTDFRSVENDWRIDLFLGFNF